VRLKQEDIVAMAGTSRATVNRVLREERGLGTVAFARSHTSMLDRGALERRCRRAL
jgi:CRP/FNR family cyclic AMP-dependent transcriptional regulator